ncbi:sensor histidine kinase [Nocardia sp. NPDC052566]|uniref:sensor histidine kinase n=1 Tax=Nocardia sp. NPDC052566 TaxID=3364330 RepID=UPI0037C82CE5
MVTRFRALSSGGRVFPLRWRRGNPRMVDAMLAVAMCTGMWLVGTVFHPPGWRVFDLWGYLLTALICLPLAARRVAPMPTLVLVSAAYSGFLLLGFLPSLNVYAPMVAFYSVATIKSPRVTAAGALLLGAVLFHSGWTEPAFPTTVAIAQAVFMPAVIWALAGVSQRLSLRNRQLIEATEQLRREQELRVEHAVVQERLQIARELHDVVAHHISVISMQAGLARYVFDSDPATARAAVHTIGATSRETLEELRRVLTLLRASDTSPEIGAAVETEPAPGFPGLAALIERVRGVGVEAELEITGMVDELPSGLQLAVYRVIQEALTNVIKHAGPCRATVVVHRDCRELTATIVDDGDSAAAVAHSGGGHGLVGMRERARLYGGTLIAGPRPDGGYTVRLAVPWPLSPTHRCASGSDPADDQCACGG